MSSFSINVTDTLNLVTQSKKQVKDYEEILNIYLNNTMNFDSAWNDHNTQVFVDTVKREQNEYNEQIQMLNLNLNIIESFCQTLKQITSNNFSMNLTSLAYNAEKIDVLISYLNECYNRLNQNYYWFRNMKVSNTFKYYSLLKTYESNTLTYRNNIDRLRTRLGTFKTYVENLMYNSRVGVNNLGVKSVSNYIMDHKYQVFSSNLIKIENKIENKGVSISG